MSAHAQVSAISASNFSQPMTRTDALYLTVTVVATVSFGDITAKTGAAGWWSPDR